MCDTPISQNSTSEFVMYKEFLPSEDKAQTSNNVLERLKIELKADDKENR